MHNLIELGLFRTKLNVYSLERSKWPDHSPDNNPSENIYDFLGTQFTALNLRSLDELEHDLIHA